jgi:tetratricopeptide (TPR) repeat protein
MEVNQTSMVTRTLQDDMASGLRLHRAGRLDEAAEIYQAALEQDATNADACCLLGVVRNQQGEPEAAVELIERAVAMRPGVAGFHANLGLAWQSMGRLAESADEYGKALSVFPDDPAAHVNRGVVVRALGDKAQALQHFRRAAELNPRLAQARTNLGELLLELGRPHDALEHCQTALVLEPELVEAHINLGNVLRVLDRLPEATRSYLEALRLDPMRGHAAAGLGLTALRRHCPDEALDWLRRAVELEPTSIELLRYLAEAAALCKLYPEVQECCRRILKIDPTYALAQNVLGYIHHEEGEHVAALERYQTALKHDPHLAIAHHNLGVLLAEMGNLEEAEASLRTTLQLEPNHVMTLARLATILKAALPDTDLASIQRCLADPHLHPENRATLLFGLAQVQDAREQFAEAAACLEQGNGLALAEQRRRGLIYDPSEHRQFVDATLAAFQPALFERLAGAGLDGPRPVFIIGLPRSGTTLLEQILASHPEVYGAGEVPLVRRSFEEIPEILGRAAPTLDLVPDWNVEMINELARRHDQRLRELDGGRAQRIVSKMHENYYYLGLIALMFPRAVVIHCRRDPRDVAFSCWIQNFSHVAWANDFDHIATRFEEYRRLMKHWKSVLTTPIHEVVYEEIVEDVEAVARRLVAACELDWHPACLEFHRTRRPVRTASMTQVRQPIYRSSVGRWKSYERELAGLFDRVGSGGDPQ